MPELEQERERVRSSCAVTWEKLNEFVFLSLILMKNAWEVLEE